MQRRALSPTAPLIRLHLLGGLEISRESHPIELPTRKMESLLAFLVLHPESHSRERLAALLWGDVPNVQARTSLRTALGVLRKHLGSEFFLASRDTVQVNSAYPRWVDALEFREAVQLSSEAMLSDLLQALSLYRGNLLPDFYDDWVYQERDQYRALYVQAALRAAQELRSRAEYERAIDWAHKVLDVEPANENAYQHLMVCYLALGNRDAALKEYAECCRALSRELDAPPQPETVALYEQIKRSHAPGLLPEAFLTNLRVPLTSFVGREQETGEIEGLLRSRGARLLTLIGAGGCGKTRLATQVALALLDHFKEGVWFVELAELTDGNLVPRAVAKVLGVRESRTKPAAAILKRVLASKQILLVLDNCEHVSSACARLVQDLLNACPNLQVLTTSREPLGIAGEQAWRVPTLNFPTATDLLGHGNDLVRHLADYDAVHLFVERARAVKQDFVLAENNIAPVVQICQRLDGIPLAIELASARVGTLGVDEVAKRLEESFGLLDGAHHGIVERHQTLQALIGWSYDLLSDEERRLLEHVSVFVGSWTLAAAESVGEVSGSRIPELLSRLVDKSLVTVVEQNGQVRYRLLEMVRQYANEKLVRCGDFERTRKLHLEWCLQLVQEAEPRLRSSARPVWMQRLEAENDNLRAGLEWSLRPDETDEEVMEKGLLLAGTLTPFWVTSGNLREGSTWLGQAIEKRRAREHRGTPGCAKALCGGALLALFEREWLRVAELCETGIPIARSLGDRGLTSLLLFLLGEYQLNHAHDLVKGYGLLEESVELAKQVGDPWQASASLFTLGSLIQFERDPERAAHLFEEGMALARRAGDPWLIGTLLDYYGEQEQSRGDYTRAAALYHESLAARRRLKDKGGMAGTLNNLGRLARHQGDLTRAAEFYRQSLELFSDLGLVEYVAIVKHNLACVSLQRGDDVLAASQFKESLGLFREIERKEGVAKCLMGLAVSERTSPNVGTRVQYFAAAQAYLEISQASLSTLFDVDDIDSAPLSSAARETMGDQAFETAMAEGRSLSLEEVLTNTRSQL